MFYEEHITRLYNCAIIHLKGAFLPHLLCRTLLLNEECCLLLSSFSCYLYLHAYYFPSVVTCVCMCVLVCLFVCLFGFLTSSSTTRLYRGRAPRQERLTILRAATHETELGDHDFCLSRSHYTDTDPTCRERAATAGIEPGTSSPGVARSTAELPRPPYVCAGVFLYTLPVLLCSIETKILKDSSLYFTVLS